MSQNVYTVVLMDTHFGKKTIFTDFEEFRSWETKHRSGVQDVIAVTANPMLEMSHKALFNDVIQKQDI